MVSFVGSLVLAAFGELIIPQLYSSQATTSQISGGNGGVVAGDEGELFLWTGAALVASVFVLLLIALFFWFEKHKETPHRQFDRLLGGLIVTALLLTVCALIVSVLYGLLAILVNMILRNSMDSTRIETVISIVTLVVTWLLSPLFINIVFSYGMGEGTVWKSFVDNWKVPGVRYAKFLLLAAVAYGVGFAVSGLLVAVRIPVIAIIGMCELVVAAAIYRSGRQPKEVAR
jgi:hypothetical protein